MILFFNKKLATKFIDFLLMIRIKHWVKNLTIFFPLIFGHYFYLDNILNGLISFMSFCFITSSVYIINDIFDKNNDIHHPLKKLRPIASNKFSIKECIAISILFFFISIIISNYFFSGTYLLIIIFYFLYTLLYSMFLKKIKYLDILVLSSFYIIRLCIGGVATEVIISIWLLTFFYLFFLSLAILKRITEISKFKSLNTTNIFGRGYTINDSNKLVLIYLISSVFSLILILFYLLSQKVSDLYNYIYYLYLTIPILGFWYYRLINKLMKTNSDDDPVNFILSDKINYYILFFFLFLFILSNPI